MLVPPGVRFLLPAPSKIPISPVDSEACRARYCAVLWVFFGRRRSKARVRYSAHPLSLQYFGSVCGGLYFWWLSLFTPDYGMRSGLGGSLERRFPATYEPPFAFDVGRDVLRDLIRQKMLAVRDAAESAQIRDCGGCHEVFELVSRRGFAGFQVALNA
jgi:hypothetical protein